MELALASQSNGKATSLVHQPLMAHEAVQGVLLDCQKCAWHSSRNDTFRPLGLSPGICPEAYSQHSQWHQPWLGAHTAKEWDVPGQFTQHEQCFALASELTTLAAAVFAFIPAARNVGPTDLSLCGSLLSLAVSVLSYSR